MGKKVVWTEEMLNYIREHYPNEPANDIAEVLRVTDTTVKNKAKEMGLKKSSTFNVSNYLGRYTHKYGFKNNN